jgi:hypothetical protein
MYKRLDRAHRAMSLVLGMLTLVSLGLLLAWNVNPKFFPIRAHGFLAAFPLAMIAIAYLLYQSARRPSAKEFLKAMMLAKGVAQRVSAFALTDSLLMDQ